MIKLSEKSAKLVAMMDAQELFAILRIKKDTADGNIITQAVDNDLREFIITKLLMSGFTKNEIENNLTMEKKK